MTALERNKIPGNVKTIHLVAICGTAMGALACMLKDLGFLVTGSDQKVYPPMSDFLNQKGIQVIAGFSEKNIAYGPDLVVVGNAVSKDNSEVRELDRLGLHFCSMPQALNGFVAKGKKAIVITGTHGKTTTSSLVAWMLHSAKLDPSFMIGGILKNFNSNYRLGKGDCIVIEGDEYDTAFFDKGAKFLHYVPHMAILTSVEFDHADIFKDLDHVKLTFNKFISGISPQSTLLAFDGDENVAELTRNKQCRIEKYGRDEHSGWRLGRIGIEPPFSRFEVFHHQKKYGDFRVKLMGEHNLLNVISSIAVGNGLGLSIPAMQNALETFESVKRRQEVRGVKKGITVMDDFAHHPTAVYETLKAVKPFYPDGRLIAVFEPRTNTSMRNVFQDVYPQAFDLADLICIRKPPMLEKIPPDQRFSSEKLVDDLKGRGKNANYFEDTNSIVEYLIKEAKSGDILLIMSNGGFDNIHETLLKRL